jgi:hypothetical protein
LQAVRVWSLSVPGGAAGERADGAAGGMPALWGDGFDGDRDFDE